VVVFDPLMAFAAGSLSTDSGMLLTCEKLLQLARLGVPTCAVVIVHHALNGLAGIKKAVGHDRSAFGRGSKILNQKTRGQINIAPVDAHSNAELVIACGKNSNGREFDPIGVELDFTRMVGWRKPQPTRTSTGRSAQTSLGSIISLAPSLSPTWATP